MGSIGKSPGKIIQVSDSSPASQAGIKVGDELLRVAGTPVDSEAAVRRAMAPFRWGDVVDVVLKRDGKEVAVPVPLRRTAEAG
jgi:S1-C subfamily serine protease